MKLDALEALDKIAPPTGDYQFAAAWYREHGYPPPGWSYVSRIEFNCKALSGSATDTWPLYCTRSGDKLDADVCVYYLIRNDLLRRLKL